MVDQLGDPDKHTPVEVGLDGVTAHPRHTGHRWFDLIMALTAIILSTVSLVVAIDHGHTERQLVLANSQLVQANSWPYVQENTTLNDHSVSMSIINSGIGPAKVEWFEMSYKGHPVHNPTELLRLCCGLPAESHQVIGKYVTSFDIGNPNQQLLRAGDTIRVMQMKDDRPAQHLIETLVQHLDDISFRACYCSVFDICWIGDLNSLATRQVPLCKADVNQFVVSLP